MKTNIFFLVFITACTSTKIIKYAALPKIVEGEGILMMGIPNLPEIQQYELFQYGHQIISKSNNMKFISELEYDLVSKGIDREQFYSNTIPDSIISAIAVETNSRYILDVEILYSKGGETLGFYTPIELNKYNAPYNADNETNTAYLIFKLIDTEVNLTESKFQVNTLIGPLVYNKDDGGETRINLTGELSAITAAFEKGMKQLKKGVIKK